jgi:hypothetical protein
MRLLDFGCGFWAPAETGDFRLPVKGNQNGLSDLAGIDHGKIED